MNLRGTPDPAAELHEPGGSVHPPTTGRWPVAGARAPSPTLRMNADIEGTLRTSCAQRH